MIKIIIVSALISGSLLAAPPVYLEDSRKDLSLIKDEKLKEMALATAMMLDEDKLRETEDEDFQRIHTGNLSQVMNVCPNQKFSRDPAPGRCSGFLIADDLLMTAGHCMIVHHLDFIAPSRNPLSDPWGATDIDIDDILNGTLDIPTVDPNREDHSSQEFMDKRAKHFCKTHKWVFDYNDVSGTDKVHLNSIYGCSEVLNVHYHDGTNLDYAIIKLDRPVTYRDGEKARTPVAVDFPAKVKKGTEVMIIGHPSGIPTKVAGDAQVIFDKDPIDNDKNVFSASLDSFGGNSGSAVFDVKKKAVIGILTRGHNDYKEFEALKCKEVIHCSESDMRNEKRCVGELVYKLNAIKAEVKEALR